MGIGAKMMLWGCQLADQLFLPGWVESSVMAAPLYRKFGFQDYEPVAAGTGGWTMKRPVNFVMLEENNNEVQKTLQSDS
jgi:hypothetical protein